MTDPTPQTPPQGLTDERLLKLAEKELRIDDMQDAHEEHYPIEVVTDGLIAAMRAAIAAHEAQRMEWLKGSREIAILTAAIDGRIAAHEAARPHLTPEDVEARFRAWWVESFPHAPVGNHAVASHVAFALHLLDGEVR